MRGRLGRRQEEGEGRAGEWKGETGGRRGEGEGRGSPLVPAWRALMGKHGCSCAMPDSITDDSNNGNALRVRACSCVSVRSCMCTAIRGSNP